MPHVPTVSTLMTFWMRRVVGIPPLVVDGVVYTAVGDSCTLSESPDETLIR
jgi:hypothetical protein